MYCRQHAVDSCTKIPSLHLEGSRTVIYSKKHPEDGLVNDLGRRCLHDSCTVMPYFNMEGNKTRSYCKHHAEEGMVNVGTKRCTHACCNKRPAWGLLADGVATTCADHKAEVSDGPMMNYTLRSKVKGCTKVSRWGLNGKKASHCRDHGSQVHGLVCTVQTGLRKRVCRSLLHLWSTLPT